METSAGIRDVRELDKLPSKVMSNHVLIRIDFSQDDGKILKTDSGLELELAGGEYNETSRVVRHGTVVITPSRLITRTAKQSFGLEWKTAMELEIGDLVYMGIMESANALELIVDDVTYYLVNYGELILRIRKGVIHALNGYALMKKVMQDKVKIDGLKLDIVDERDKRRGIITHVGRPNDYYFGVNMVDAEIEVGDEVSLNIPAVTKLEDDLFANIGEDVYYAQRRWLAAKYESA